MGEALGAVVRIEGASGGMKVREGGRRPGEGASGGGGAELGHVSGRPRERLLQAEETIWGSESPPLGPEGGV